MLIQRTHLVAVSEYHMKKMKQAFPEISILSYGKGWLAVDKPAGMSTHNDPGCDLCSVVGIICANNAELLKILDIEREFGLNPVHRLDKDTSGVVLLSCRIETFRYFSNLFESRKVNKTYAALLHGTLESTHGETQYWNQPLSKEAGGRNRPQGGGVLSPSRTWFRPVEHSPHYTLIECGPETGRKHQIRRHAKLSGHPILGDSRYGSKKACRFVSENFGFNRLGLHAASLFLILPGKTDPEFVAESPVPIIFSDIINKDRLL